MVGHRREGRADPHLRCRAAEPGPPLGWIGGTRRCRLPRLPGRAHVVCRGPCPGGRHRLAPGGHRGGSRRPGGPRHAQLPGMGTRLLGHVEVGRRRRRPERLVDRTRDGVRPGGLLAEGTALRRREARAHRSLPGCPAVRWAHARGRRPPRPRCRIARRRRPVGGCRGRCRRPAGRTHGRYRAGGRPLHLLHLGHHRASEGSRADPPWRRLQPLEPGLLADDGRSSPGHGRGSRRAAPGFGQEARRVIPRLGPGRTAVPRHRLQLLPASGHRGRWPPDPHAPLERRDGPRADREGAAVYLHGRSDHGPRADQQPGLRPTGHLQPLPPGWGRCRCAAGPGAQDRRAPGGSAQHRLRPHGGERRHLHQRQPVLRGQAGIGRFALSGHGDPDSRGGRNGPAHRWTRRALGTWRQRVPRLSEPARGERRVPHRRLVPHRRHRLPGRGRLPVPGGSGQGHGPAQR